MLDISKIEAWKIWFFYEYFNLGEFLENFINYIKPLALEKNIEINVKIDYANIVLYSDKTKLSQLLNNIFSNAIKFSSNNWNIYFNSYIYDNKVYFKIKDNWLLALSKINDFRPFIILLDIMMPQMDWFETLKAMKELTTTFNNTKIIIFSNLNSSKDIEKWFLFWADDYILKSDITPRELVDKIQKYI